MANLILQGIDADALVESIAAAVLDRLRPVLSESHLPMQVDGDEMARLAGVSRTTIDRAVRDNVIPSVMIGRRRLFRPAEVIAAFALSTNEKGGDRHEQ